MGVALGLVRELFKRSADRSTGRVIGVLPHGARRESFFHHTQAALRYALHETRRDFLIFVRGEDALNDPGG